MPVTPRCGIEIGESKMKKSPLLFVAAGLTLGVAACDEPRYDATPERSDIPEVTVEATPAEEAAAPAVETAPEAPPVDTSALPPDARTSEETVRPESETMFY